MIVAIVNDNIVAEIRFIDDADYSSVKAQFVVDIAYYNPCPQVGWSFDGYSFQGKPTSMIITKLAMRHRFTVAEMIGIYTAAKSNSVFQYLIDNLSVATYIDLLRPDTQQAVLGLAQAGLITMTRANEILTTIPTEVENYKGIL